LESRIRKLDKFFERAKAKTLDDEIRSDLARHGAVLVCGFIERSVEVIILERLSNKAHPRVLNFLKSHFKRGTNYDCEPIFQLLERFDTRWSQRFRKFLTENPSLAEQITSAYSLRNSIAHGGDANRGIAGVIELYDAAKKLVDGLIQATE
jgi:hypothetical protein